ncbi:MAG: RNA-guided endonuclease InsQ/TnpB family protein, partial [Candidatus Heimdallarchaeota archaeon]
MRTLTRTIRVPVISDNGNYQLLSDTMKEYSKAAQMAYNYGRAYKTNSRTKIHHAIYYPFRAQSALNSQLVINGKNKGVDVLKSLKKKPRVQFGSLPIRYDARCSKINIKEFKVSVATIGPRIDLDFEIPKYYHKYLNWKFRSFELVKIRKRFYLHFVVIRQISFLEAHSTEFVGIDRGIRHLAVTSRNKFYSGSDLREVKNKYLRLKRELQKKGTRSAKYKLKRIAGREKRFQKDLNHCISKKIIKEIPENSSIILEDLSSIRKTARTRRKSRSSRELNSWAFYQFQTFLTYKAAEKNIEVIYVDPRYTSQRCSVCGYISRNNRIRSNFQCR